MLRIDHPDGSRERFTYKARFGYDAVGRKAWQYATTLPAEKLSQIQNPLIKPERYVEHAYNSIHRRYEYDLAGELSRTLDKLRGEVSYEYEANGRLLEQNPKKRFEGEAFRYDAAGNRLNFNTSRFDHVKDNRLKEWRNHEYKYDAWGNLIEKIVGIVRWQTFTYDSENRLVKTETMANSQVEVTSSYQYDSLGRRVGKQSDIQGQTDQKRFLWQGLRMLREESPEQSSLYLYEPGSYAPLARVDQKEGETENTIYYYHTDQIGTPLEMTDAEGHIVWQAKYAPWGLIKQLVVNEVEQNLRFQGQYFDVETGLHYNTFRYYDPEIGRFITQDPIGLSGGDNLYLYAPNPYGWIDPWGLCNSSSGGAKGTGTSLDNIASNIHTGQQGKHIIGHNNFIPGRSYFNEGVDPQRLLNGARAGEFSVIGYGSRGQPIVDFGKNIGIDGSSGLATRYGTIHSGKSGAHIVPTNPNTIGAAP